VCKEASNIPQKSVNANYWPVLSDWSLWLNSVATHRMVLVVVESTAGFHTPWTVVICLTACLLREVIVLLQSVITPMQVVDRDAWRSVSPVTLIACLSQRAGHHHRCRSSVNFGGGGRKTFLSENRPICMKKLTKWSNFTWCLPEKYFSGFFFLGGGANDLHSSVAIVKVYFVFRPPILENKRFGAIMTLMVMCACVCCYQLTSLVVSVTLSTVWYSVPRENVACA